VISTYNANTSFTLRLVFGWITELAMAKSSPNVQNDLRKPLLQINKQEGNQETKTRNE